MDTSPINITYIPYIVDPETFKRFNRPYTDNYGFTKTYENPSTPSIRLTVINPIMFVHSQAMNYADILTSASTQTVYPTSLKSEEIRRLVLRSFDFLNSKRQNTLRRRARLASYEEIYEEEL